MANNILSLLDKIRAIATEGLTYTKDQYDIDRYEKLMNITVDEYSEILDISSEKTREELRKEIGSITPKLGTDIAITSVEGKLLILKRTDDQSWSLPCGWVDVGEEPFQTAVRESKEESGVDIDPLGYITITEKGPHLYSGFMHQVNVLVASKPVEKDVSIVLSHEHSEYKWIDENEAKEINWHPGHERLARPIFRFIKDGRYIPHSY